MANPRKNCNFKLKMCMRTAYGSGSKRKRSTCFKKYNACKRVGVWHGARRR